MAENGFAQTHAFGTVGDLPAIDPGHPMTACYFQQVEQHARLNPHDAHAQRMYAHWLHGMQQIEAARRAAAAAASHPVPSNLSGAEAPTPPGSLPVLSPHFGAAGTGPLHAGPVLHGSLEQRFTSTGTGTRTGTTPSSSIPPSRQRSQTPRPRTGRRRNDDEPHDARRRARTRSCDENEYHDSLGLGTRRLSAENTLKHHTDTLVKNDAILRRAGDLIEQLQTRIATAEGLIEKQVQSLDVVV